MLEFLERPDAVFTQVVTGALESTIDDIQMILDFKDSDVFVNGFEDEIIGAFGGGVSGIKALQHELRRLLQAHLAVEVYSLTDYHFKLLDRALQCWCNIYTDMAHDIVGDPNSDKDLLIVHDGRPIMEMDFEYIQSIYFRDDDYDWSPSDINHIRHDMEARAQLGVSSSAINAALASSPGFMDLRLERVEVPDWGGVQDYEGEEIDWHGDHVDEEE